MVTCKCDSVITTPGTPNVKVLSFLEKLCHPVTGEPFQRFYDFAEQAFVDFDLDMNPIENVEGAVCCDDAPPTIITALGAGLTEFACTVDAEGNLTGKVFACKVVSSDEDQEIDEDLGLKWIALGTNSIEDYDPAVHGAWVACEFTDPICDPVVDGGEITASDTGSYVFSDPVNSVEILNCNNCILVAEYNYVDGAAGGNGVHYIMPNSSHAIMTSEKCLIESVEVTNTKGGDFQVFINGLKCS